MYIRSFNVACVKRQKHHVNNHKEAFKFVFLHETQKIPFPLTYENISNSDLHTNIFLFFKIYIFKRWVHMLQKVELHFHFLRPIS
jgi:hypothetical protein